MSLLSQDFNPFLIEHGKPGVGEGGGAAFGEAVAAVDVHARDTWGFPRGELKAAQLLTNTGITRLLNKNTQKRTYITYGSAYVNSRNRKKTGGKLRTICNLQLDLVRKKCYCFNA